MSVITSLGTLRLENNKEDIIKAAVSIFGCLSSTPSDLISTMDSLTLFVQSFDSSFEQLVAKIMAYDWYTGNQEVIDRIVIFLNKLACTQVCFVEPILTGIVRKLIPRTIQDASNSSDYVSNRAFGAVVQLLNSVPNSTLKLPQIASRAFPFMKRPKEEISGFVKNLLDICANFPTLRSDLLLIIVEEMVKLDVRASREDVEERQQSSYELDVDPEEMFPMETNSAAVTHEETVATAADEKTLHEMGSRLDECLSLLFEFIVLTDSNTPSDGKGNALEKLYKDLLEAFQTKVLPVYACCHTQFLIFRICGMQQRLCRHFLSWLWSKFSDPSVPAILRQTSGCYMASLVARAKFISIEDSKSHLTTWLQWITSYMGTQEVRKQSWAIHGTFYSLCQAVFYVVAFRLKEFLAVPGGLNFLQSLGLERIVNCRLNPLKFCFSHVVDNFALITRNYQLAFCYSVIDRNKRQSCGEVDSTVGQNPLEGFFPFDPYVLRKSKRFIDEFYRDYRGLTEEDEEGEDMVMAESFSPRSLERPKDLVWYGTSPGFKHG